MRLGVIGAGKIIPFHLEAAIKAGFSLQAIVATKDSINARNISEKFSFKYCFSDLNEFISNLNELDAILIASEASTLFPILSEISNVGIPILIEKPIFTDFRQLSLARNIPHQEKVFVGYNRRFYKTILELKDFIKKYPSAVVKISIPELSGVRLVSKDSINRTLAENSVHMLDLAQYFFGAAALEINRLDSAVVKSDYVRVSFTDDNLKYCELSFGYSDNYSIELLADGQRIQVKPLEILNIYDEMEILQPDETFTFKRYIPRATENNSNYMVEESFLKPGFELQYMEFFDFVKGIKSNKAANLKDAIRVSTFALGLQNLLANHINSG
jgi:predicted dehydrogenase